VGAHADGARGLPNSPQPPDEWCIGLADDERFVAIGALPASQQEDLSLAPTPFAAAVDVQYS
ncbi:MAG: hypothetical protein H7066_06990, partial [Cytophagaceae bacterium]|nr:hypothetical protein [Gemmatimonadaceae bacterium]